MRLPCEDQEAHVKCRLKVTGDVGLPLSFVAFEPGRNEPIRDRV
jgi:hypothetical protein